MKLTPLVLAVRAVSAEFARRIYIPVLYGGGAGLFGLLALSIWLVTTSGWWWFLLGPVILLTLLFITLAAIAQVAMTWLRPQQTKAQAQTVRSFVDDLEKTSETIQTPKFIILFRLIKDLLLPGKRSYVHELSSTARSLQTGFSDVLRSF